MEILKNFLSSNWSVSGKGFGLLYNTAKAIDSHTRLWEDRVSSELAIDSYCGTAQNEYGEKMVAYHELGPDIVNLLKMPQIKLNAKLCPVKEIKELYGDFVRTGVLIRYPADPKPDEKQYLFSVDPGFFNQIGKSSGSRYSDMGRGLTRALAIEDQIVRQPYTLSLLIKYDESGAGKIFRVARDRYNYVKQRFFAENVDNFLIQANQEFLKEGKSWKWEITDWEISHYITKIKAEVPQLNEYLRKQGIDITPALIFYTSETGDSPMAIASCMCVDNAESKYEAYSTKHMGGSNHVTEFFDDIYQNRKIIENLLDKAIRLKNLKSEPANKGDFRMMANKLNLATFKTGKREVVKVLAAEEKESLRYDVSLYDIFRRILNLPNKVERTRDELAKLTGEVIKKIA